MTEPAKPRVRVPARSRRIGQCHRDDCELDAEFEAWLHVNCCAPGVTRAVKMKSSIICCNRHRLDVKDYVLSDRNKDVIATKLIEGGYPEPDFLSARIEFVPLPPTRTVLHAQGPAVAPVPCDRAECERPARWQIKQVFRLAWQKGTGRPLIEALTKMCVCDRCRELVRPRDLMDPEDKAATQAWLVSRGILNADFKTMQVGFEPMVDGEMVDPVQFVGRFQPYDLNTPKAQGATDAG